MNLAVANLKSRVVKQLEKKPLRFNQLVKALRIQDEKRLDNALQTLRRTGQIHYTGPIHGWRMGRGAIYTPMQRFRHGWRNGRGARFWPNVRNPR